MAFNLLLLQTLRDAVILRLKCLISAIVFREIRRPPRHNILGSYPGKMLFAFGGTSKLFSINRLQGLV